MKYFEKVSIDKNCLSMAKGHGDPPAIAPHQSHSSRLIGNNCLIDSGKLVIKSIAGVCCWRQLSIGLMVREILWIFAFIQDIQQGFWSAIGE